MGSSQQTERIAIAGAGVAGAYLYRLLKNRGIEADIFDVSHPTRCGLSPCAWGTTGEFRKLVKLVGLDPEKYILRSFDCLVVDEMRVKAELMTIDKPKFIHDLLAGDHIKRSKLSMRDYDRIVDATGVSRYFLPKIEKDTVLSCHQSLLEAADHLEIGIRTQGTGYAWCFPLSGRTYHIGFGNIDADPRLMLNNTGWLPGTTSGDRGKVVCGCASRIRLTGPHGSRPFVIQRSLGGPSAGVWGVGEAIGCVAPLAGEGIVPAMKSALLLFRHWDDADGYTRAILKQFDWMKEEQKVLEKLIHRIRLGNGDARALWMNARKRGVKISVAQASLLMMRLR